MESSNSPHKSLKVLIVDDELLIRKSLQRVFEKQGHQVHLADDGEPAIKLWQEIKPDLVILDVLMPKIGGVEVMTSMKETTPELLSVPIVIISAYSAGGTKEDFTKLGATDFIRKPFDDVYKFVNYCVDLVKTT